MTGKTMWYIPDCYWPADGTAEPYVSHESICVLNTTDTDAELTFTLFFEDREPAEGYHARCAARRAHHVRMDRLVSDAGVPVPRGVPYAAAVISTVPVFVQYSRCDTTQTAMAFMTAIPSHG